MSKIRTYTVVFLSVIIALEGGGAALALDQNATLQAMLGQPTVAFNGTIIRTEELNRLYTLRTYKPIWDISTKEKADSLKSFISSMTAFIGYNGLNEKDYPSEDILKLLDNPKKEDQLKFEVLMTEWVLTIAHDLYGNRVNLKLIYPGWTFRREPLDFATDLARAAEENRVHELLASLPPSGTVYQTLAQQLKIYRDMEKKGLWPTVTPGPTLKPGMHDARVVQVRERLAAEGYTDKTEMPRTEAERYDEFLKGIVETYQARNGLEADGNIGAKTFAAMNVSVRERVDQIIANMERWRYMPEKFPNRYAQVNIADATIDIIDEGKNIYHGPVVVGRPDRKTPFIQSSIRSVIFNPSWHVPAKIARKDILPKLRKDPHYLEKLGFVINGSADDPYGETIDWKQVEEREFHFRLRQSPGDMNSLGRLKFDFDNDFAVYMHGTPHQELFKKAERNQSSGCVRLRDPDLIAQIVLSPNEDEWSLDRIHEETGKRKTRWLGLSQPLPLYIVYWSVFPSDDNGPLNFRNDVYDYDSFLIETLREKSKDKPDLISAAVT